MTKRNLFNSCSCALALPRLLWLFGVGVGWRLLFPRPSVRYLKWHFLWWITMMGTSIFLCTWECVQYKMLSQILPWYKFLLATKVPMTQILPVRWPRELIYQYEVSYIMFQRYRIVLLVRYSLTTLYRIFRQGTGHKDFAARVLTLLSLSL